MTLDHPARAKAALGRSADAVTALVVTAFLAVTTRLDAIADHRRSDAGQATAEYALVLLGAAAVALAVISWATRTNLIGRLLDMVFGGLLRKAR